MNFNYIYYRKQNLKNKELPLQNSNHSKQNIYQIIDIDVLFVRRKRKRKICNKPYYKKTKRNFHGVSAAIWDCLGVSVLLMFVLYYGFYNRPNICHHRCSHYPFSTSPPFYLSHPIIVILQLVVSVWWTVVSSQEVLPS